MASTVDGQVVVRTGRFALLAECMLVGLWLTLSLLPLVTGLAAFAAACRHLARFCDGERGGLREYLADLRAALPGSWWRSLAGWAVLAAVGLDVVIARLGLPGAPVIIAATCVFAAGMLIVAWRAAVTWKPGARWRELLREAVSTARDDVPGTGLIAGGLLVLAVVTWQLAPLFVPAIGCLAGAVLAVHRRRTTAVEDLDPIARTDPGRP